MVILRDQHDVTECGDRIHSYNWLSRASTNQLHYITVYFPNNYIFTKLLEFINVTFNFVIIENISTERNLKLRITDCQDKLAKFIKLKAAINFMQNLK